MRTFATIVLGLLVATASAQPFIIDGQFDDWPANAVTATDAAGDATGQLDVTEISGVLAGNTVFVSLTITEPFNLQSGSSTNPDLKLVLDGGTGTAVEIRFRGRRVVRRDSNQTLTWDAVRYSSAPTVAADQFEIRVDLSGVGGVADGSVSVWLEGSDTLSGALTIQEAAPAGPPTPARADARLKRGFRVVSLNTLRTGLFKPAQAERLARLLASAEADIYLLQEEYESSGTQIEDLFNTIMPLGKGAAWQAHKRGDTVIVARWAVSGLPNYDTSYSAAAVLTPQGPIVVVSQHPKCCGYIGSSEDLRRIQQAALTARVIDEVRAGQHDGALVLRDAPVIIGGDWNLVGSRGPLDRLTAPELPGVSELTMVNRGKADVSTWRELDGLGFPPGRLDLVVFDAERLDSLDARVFDSALLTQAQLDRLGLQATDSLGSDHLMLIADFLRLPGADD
jgi:endonuclease/exonuclease/phosphatase family protein